MNEMQEYVRYHFSAEEEYIRKVNYPDLPSHKKIHDKFYVQIKGLYHDIREGKPVLNTEIMKILMNWLEDHILNEDMKYSQFIASLGRRK